jgi:hypothetical protein
MERGLLEPLSLHDEVTLRRIALGISKAKHLPAGDVAHLLRLFLVVENDGRLTLTDIGHQRYRTLPKGAGMMAVETADEATAVVANYVLRARQGYRCSALSVRATCSSQRRSDFIPPVIERPKQHRGAGIGPPTQSWR